jgi:hypothetical protein
MNNSVEDIYRGYRSLSTFLDSDENFMLYRRFGYLHSRILLRKQDKLRKLEDELDSYDNDDAHDTTDSRAANRRLLMSRSSDESACRKESRSTPGKRTRTDILDDIEEGLKEYG